MCKYSVSGKRYILRELHRHSVVCVRSFKTSKNDHIIEVQLYDDIDFICPYYPAKSSSSSSSTPEYYTIYMVRIRVYACVRRRRN